MRRTIVALVLAAAAASLGAQERPTFRGGANYVRVDMYATVDGRPVGDLTVKDVALLEDGVPQAIEAFEHVVVRPVASETLADPTSVADSRQQAADPRARVFVIFLDTYHTTAEGSVNMRQPLVQFLDRVIGPDDLVAVMTPEMGASDIAFSRKTTVIANMMQTEWWGRRARVADDDPKEQLYDACGASMGLSPELVRELRARRREKLTLDALDDLVVYLGGIREERKAVLAVTEGWLLYGRNAALAAPGKEGPASPPIFRPPVAPPTERGTVTQPLQIECEADRIALSNIDHQDRLRRIGEDANRGNVTFYPVFARGLVAIDAPMGPDRPPASPLQDAANLRTRQDSLRALAADTDGESIINTNNIGGAIQRIADDLSSYYLMGYYSTNTRLDGRFRQITVRVSRPGVRVRARRGYRALTAGDVRTSAVTPAPVASADDAAMARAMNAVAGSSARAELRIHTAAWSRNATTGAFWVAGELDARTRREAPWTAGAQADVTVLSPDGASMDARTIDVPAAQGVFFIQVPESGTVAPGEYAVRVRLRPKSGSGLSLTDSVKVTFGAPAPMGDAVISRRGPSTALQYARTADLRFQRNERIRLELPASSEGVASARLLDRGGKPLQVPAQVTERSDAGAALRWLVVDATLAPLAPGDYAIEVALGGQKQVTGFRIVP
jgi:VWFA-related protein